MGDLSFEVEIIDDSLLVGPVSFIETRGMVELDVDILSR